MKRLWSWLKWVLGLGTMVAAMFFIFRAGSHRKKQTEREEKIKATQDKAGEFIGSAKSEQHKAQAAKRRAEAALEEGRARIEKLKENGNEDLADRVERFNRRLRNR